MDSAQQAKLEKLFTKVLRDTVPIPKSEKDSFIDAICANMDPVSCIRRLFESSNGVPSLCAAVRYDSSSSFINKQAIKLLNFLRTPEIEQIGGGQNLQKLLIALVTPPIFWKALCSAFNKRSLDADGELCFAWLMYKLVSYQTSENNPFRKAAQEKHYINKFLKSSSHETRTYARQIKHILETGKVADGPDISSLPGGRHDNDFSDFRKIAIMPTADEIHSARTKAPFLRMADFLDDSSTEGDRASIHRDNQFRLLREDVLSQIREELSKIQHGHKSSIYRGVRVLKIHCGEEKWTKWKILFQLADDLPIFQTERVMAFDKREEFLKDHRRILPHQSPACLIIDGDIIAFALIDRYEEMLAEDPPVIGLQFEGEEIIMKTLSRLRKGKEITLFELDVAMFAYEPVLRAIQKDNQFPMSQELLFWNKTPVLQAPKYMPQAVISALIKDPNKDLQGLIKTPKSIVLDDSQRASFLSGLTQRVSLIQGPPGTGKSFIGAILAKTIHDFTSQNILVVCYTHHALDQFLEDLFDIGIPQGNIVRLGSVDKATARTAPIALKNLKENLRLSGTDRLSIGNLKSDIERRSAQLHLLFESCQSPSTTSPRKILKWLESRQPEYFAAFQVVKAEDGMIQANHKGKTFRETDLLYRWRNGRGPGTFTDKKKHIWEMKQAARRALLAQWKEAIVTEALTDFCSAAKKYNECIHQLERKFSKKDRHVLRCRRIIGCTTTAAAKYTELIQSASPSVLLVEEAGEILESHILTALGRDKDQLILIGDHKQLRPKVNTYRLTVEKGDGFDLNRSLFERLILKEYPHQMLSQQHRMRPEISALVRQLTYPNLVDAPRTEGRPDLRGVTDNLIFINHNKREDDMAEIADRADSANTSRQNKHEVELVLKIVRYLAQQGYRTSDMVVLTPYLGQLQLLASALSSEADPVLNDLDSRELIRATSFLSAVDEKARKRPLRIATIDNYQGEESDIAIVSLTRSNAQHDIGFMSSPERVNVMLSRARNALIMIGNMGTFMHARKGSKLWTSLLGMLSQGGHVYEGLPVKCENHPGKTAILKSPEDFHSVAPDGGCKEPCDIYMKCGKHKCPSRCHWTDDHSRISCQVVVPNQCDKGHDTPYRCFRGPFPNCSLCEEEKRAAVKQQNGPQRKKFEREKGVRVLATAKLARKANGVTPDTCDAQTKGKKRHLRKGGTRVGAAGEAGQLATKQQQEGSRQELERKKRQEEAKKSLKEAQNH